MVTINLSAGKPIHSQRNNKLRPGGTCGPTSAANAIISAEIPFKYPDDKQLEDYITEKLMTKGAVSLMKKDDPSATYNPWNTATMIVWAVNELAGKPVSEVKYLTIQEIVYNLAVLGNPLVVGGSFTKSRHFVCLVGLETDQENIKEIESPNSIEIIKIKNFIVDDSWGDYSTGYKSEAGNDTKLPLPKFLKLVMEGDTKKKCQVYYRNGIKNI